MEKKKEKDRGKSKKKNALEKYHEWDVYPGQEVQPKCLNTHR